MNMIRPLATRWREKSQTEDIRQKIETLIGPIVVELQHAINDALEEHDEPNVEVEVITAYILNRLAERDYPERMIRIRELLGREDPSDTSEKTGPEAEKPPGLN